MKRLFFLLLLIILLLTGCDEQGLNPNDVASETGFGGKITFTSKIPPQEKIEDLRIVAVPYYPVDTTVAELIAKVLSSVIPFTESLPTAVDSGSVLQYKFLLKPQTYPYVAVVQRYGSNFFLEWKVISVYGFSSAKSYPDTVIVKENRFVSNINFEVDYNNLPPQPFKTP